MWRGEADAPLRQIEAQFVPHRPAQPRIDPRRRRPYPFDQSADDDSVGLRQPRFQRAIDFQMDVCGLRPPHHAVGKGSQKYFRIIAELNRQAALRLSARQIVERGYKCRSWMALEYQRDAMLVARQLHQNVAMAFCQLGEVIWL